MTEQAEVKAHSLTQLTADTNTKFNIGSDGGALVLLPKNDEVDDIILIVQDSLYVVSMYMKPEITKDWKITDSHIPIMFETRKNLSDGPTEIELKEDQAVFTYKDGTRVTSAISRTVQSIIIENAEATIKSIPESCNNELEVTKLIKDSQTSSVSCHDGITVVGNDFFGVKYGTSIKQSIRIKDKYLMDNIRIVAKTVKGSVTITRSGQHAVVSTNSGETSERSEEAHIYLIMNNNEEKDVRPAKDVVNDTITMIESESRTKVLSAITGIAGLFTACKNVLSKFTGDSKSFVITIDKKSITARISDSTTSVENTIELEDIEFGEDVNIPKDLIIRTSVLQYLFNLSDNILSLYITPSGKGDLLVLETDNETAIFAVA
jgi:hypothetical protein